MISVSAKGMIAKSSMITILEYGLMACKDILSKCKFAENSQYESQYKNSTQYTNSNFSAM